MPPASPFIKIVTDDIGEIVGEKIICLVSHHVSIHLAPNPQAGSPMTKKQNKTKIMPICKAVL